MRRYNPGFTTKVWPLAALAALCGCLAAVAGLTSVASATTAPRTTVLSKVPTISVFAGNGSFHVATPGPAQDTSIGGVASDIAVDRSGDTFLADAFNYYVYKVTPDGTLSIFAGDGSSTNAPTPGPATSSSVGQPAGLACDKAGNLYIADFDHSYVYKVTPGGTLSIFAGNGSDVGTPSSGPATSEPLSEPRALAVDPSGNLYIASYNEYQIYKVTPGGELSVFAGAYGYEGHGPPGPATEAGIGVPSGIAIDTAGNVYITDLENDYVYKVTPGGTLSIFAGNGTHVPPTAGPVTHSSVGAPQGVAVDGNGNVFIVDGLNDLLCEVTPSGTLSIYAGKQANIDNATPGPATASAIGAPDAIGIDPASGYLYTSNTANSYIYRITPAPGYWLAGAGGYVSGANGAVDHGSLTASASDPVVGIASDSAGYWLVTRSGSVHAYGDAGFYKDLPTMGVHVSDIVAIAPTQDRKGYWLIGADGGEFAFGDATFHGSLPGLGIHVDNIVGMVANPSGSGYILVGSDGGVFVFGGSFHGSLPGLGIHVNNIVGILPTGGGAGYVLVGSDGGAFVFGHGSGFYGSLPGEGVHVNDVVGLALAPDQGGYWMAEANGNVHPFGDAPSLGTPAGSAAHLPVVGIGAS